MLVYFDEIQKLKCTRAGVIPYVKIQKEGGNAHSKEGGNAHSKEGGNAHSKEGGNAHSKELHFLMGIDASTGEYSDMGGGIKIDENIISCALRELTEETKELIQPEHLKQIKVGIYDKINSNCIIFCELKNSKLFHTIIPNFAKSEKHGLEYDEMSGLVWLTTEEMIKNIYGEPTKMWSRIKCTLANCGNFDDHLLSLL